MEKTIKVCLKCRSENIVRIDHDCGWVYHCKDCGTDALNCNSYKKLIWENYKDILFNRDNVFK